MNNQIEDNQIDEIRTCIEKETSFLIIKQEEDINVKMGERSECLFSKDNPKRIKMTESEDESNTKVQCTSNERECVEVNVSLEELRMPQLKDKSINCFYLEKRIHYIGSSNGLLLRYTKGGTHIFDKCTDDDILQIFTMSDNSVIARTNTLIIKYSNTGVKQCSKDVPQMRNAFYDDFSILITFTNGSVDRICKTDFSSLEGYEPSLTNVCFYCPKIGNSKFNLLSHEDSNLYKIKDGTFESVEGVTNVKNVLRMKWETILCYSDVNIWILNSKCDVTDMLEIEEGIQFVSCIKRNIVVVDANNMVRVYLMRRRTWKQLRETKIEGKITAVAMHPLQRKVFIAVGDCVYIF